MTDQDSGDKSQAPTEKRRQDARKKGDIAKSKETTSTMTLLVWLGLAVSALPLAGQEIRAFALKTIAHIGGPSFEFTASAMGWLAMQTLLWTSAMLLIPVMLVGLVTEFLQTGALFTWEKIKPQLSHLDPVAGTKKMFSSHNLVELIKATLKTILLFWIGWQTLHSLLPQIMQLSHAPASFMGHTMWRTVVKLLSWTVCAFLMVSVFDLIWQRHSHTRKLRMSLQDIKKEIKQSEGDPLIKMQRQQTHQEWAQQSAADSASRANVLIVNPTHVAIAIDYDPQSCPVPTLSAKGQDDTALAMREAAMKAGVPIVRNIAVAHSMLVRTEVGEIIPQDLFDTMAEIILWARQVRRDIQAHTHPLSTPPNSQASKRCKAPGKDLTRYPSGFNPKTVVDHSQPLGKPHEY
jgi:type III secretion protein U